MKILNRYNNEVIYKNSNCKSIKELVEKAVKEGVNLRGANLYNANLENANLENANLYNANLEFSKLEGANLYNANLENANLENANLYNANLHNANLYDTNLEDAYLEYVNLENTNLKYCIGNNKEVKSLQLGTYLISYTKDILNIGCQSYPIEKWESFTDEEISEMDEEALEWWVKWKDILFKTIELSKEV